MICGTPKNKIHIQMLWVFHVRKRIGLNILEKVASQAPKNRISFRESVATASLKRWSELNFF